MSEADHNIDEYQLVNCISTGTHTQVWEVADKGGGQYALKLLLPDAFQDLEQKQVLKHEAKIGKSLEHPNLIRLHKAVFTKQHGYVVMDYFRAPNLKVQLHGDLVAVQARVRKLVESLSLALGYMHEKGWLHRDIKPDNILLNKSSEVRLIDYSLSTRKGKQKIIQGTRTYIAPETILKKALSPQTDMYSLGVTVFEVLTGTPPFTGASPNDLLKKHVGEKAVAPSLINKNVTPEMDAFVLRLLAKKPADRPKTMNEVYAEFRNLKVFKEDVQELYDRRQKDEKAKRLNSLDMSQRLDSRADAERSQLVKDGVVPASSKPARKPAAAAARPAPAAHAQPAAHEGGGYPQPMPGGYPQQVPFPPPGYPQYAPDAQQPPFAPPYAGQPPYGAPWQGGYPPAPQQGYPGGPPMPQPYPQGGPQYDPNMQPGQSPPPGQQPPSPGGGQPQQQSQPAAQGPSGAQPNAASRQQSGAAPPQPAQPSRGAQPPASQPVRSNAPDNDDDLPLMEELPPVI